MELLKRYTTTILILLIILATVSFRIFAYGDLRLSVGYADTPSYIESAAEPLFSWKLFAGKRLFTTNLIYKLANDPVQCPLLVMSNPALGIEVDRIIQPCFENIALLQNILAIFAWSLLAWTISRQLKSPIIKIIGAALLLTFAFTPQIAEWDYILSPESLTFSLYLITFSLVVEIGFRAIQKPDPFSSNDLRFLITASMIVFTFWVFVRDVNLYTIIVTIGLLALLKMFRTVRQTKMLIILIGILVGIFVLGNKSASDSLRATHYPLEHSFDTYIFPYQQRVDYMKNYGMPERDSDEFESWFDSQATKTFGLFLITHPGFVVTTMWDNTFYFESDFEQPYYRTNEIHRRDFSYRIGQFLHPETPAIYLIDLLILVAFVVKAIRFRQPQMFVWTWLAAWLFFCSFVTLFLTFWGDTVGTRRHIFPSVEMFRLYLWIFVLPHLDTSILTSSANSQDAHSVT